MSYNNNYRRYNGNPNHFSQPSPSDRGRQYNQYNNFYIAPPPAPPSLVPPRVDNGRDYRRRSDYQNYSEAAGYQGAPYQQDRLNRSEHAEVLTCGRQNEDNRKRRRYDQSQNNSFSSDRSFGVKRDQGDVLRRQSYQRNQEPVKRLEKYDLPYDCEDECTEEELRYYLNITEEEVPVYALRMRKMGIEGYPPAFVDSCVKVSNTLPFFGDEDIFTKRVIKAEDLIPIKGYTHVDGDQVSEDFAKCMQHIADYDYKQSHSEVVKKAKQAGLNLDTSRTEVVEERKVMEETRFEIPAYDLSFDDGYSFGERTKEMKHNLEGFRDGIQPFVAPEPNVPSNFMIKLRTLMKESGSKKENGTKSAACEE
ncbi:unnamed protein product [Bursaphelenchus okinawaensis]|uniref:PSP proline-rich domain-containing protein n=1 Tax=Bursaphelenchus okinawaensis TaxID=465554 RepID=A0A811KIV8_9BILA|nr:unnamed protein product [Bursaphelenchus okinawaensis]CAG9104103.1 unnamed protein product [Bursaphelenchus okinawaensis]